MAKIAFGQVGIVGTGMIGQSLGLALKRLSPAPRVVGFDISSDSRRSALSNKAVDSVTNNLAEAVRDADLVVMAAPVRAIELGLRDVAPLLRPGCVVTDTASTKRQVLDWAAQYLPDSVSFVGGHPMTGRLTSGSAGPSADIFNNAVYCVTPPAASDATAVEKIVKMVEAIGCVAYFVEPDEHDGLVATISHLPYILSSSMMRVAATDRGWREARTIAAGGFSTSTALTENDPRMFADICLTNADQIGRQIDRYIEELQTVRTMIAAGDERIYDRFVEAQNQRFEWLAGRGQEEAPPVNLDDLKPQNLFFPSRLGEILGLRERGKR
ncbi:MAG: prephenate dehydrogenase/arogenate dehydrogenase family protein [Chloroflexota bacterium]